MNWTVFMRLQKKEKRNKKTREEEVKASGVNSPKLLFPIRVLKEIPCDFQVVGQQVAKTSFNFDHGCKFQCRVNQFNSAKGSFNTGKN